MKLDHFFNKASDSRWWHDVKILIFVFKTAKPVFLGSVKDQLPFQVNSADYREYLENGGERFSQSFLGQTQSFWFGFLEASGIAESKKRKQFLNQMSFYKGPHRLIFGVPEGQATIKNGNGVVTVDVDEYINCLQFSKLAQFVSSKQLPQIFMTRVERIFKRVGRLDIDQACFLATMLSLVSSKMLPEFEEHFIMFHGKEGGFRDLVEFFFRKDGKSFFALWDKIKSEYSEHYWTAFWSGQFWRAYQVIGALQSQGPSHEIKRIAYGLPYAFVWKNGWKKYSLQKIGNLYDKLYRIDCRLKTGGSDAYLIDSLFLNHFSEQS